MFRLALLTFIRCFAGHYVDKLAEMFDIQVCTYCLELATHAATHGSYIELPLLFFELDAAAHIKLPAALRALL
jgi:hypothetical protein